MITTITNENFEDNVLNNDKPVLLDFWAKWCTPCNMLSPVIDEIASQNDHISVCKINIDDEPQLATRFNVMSIPTIMVMKNGVITNWTVGVKSKEEILKLLQ